MKYLVFATGGPGFGSADQALEVLQREVIPSFNEFLALEKKKKIVAGGLPVGAFTSAIRSSTVVSRKKFATRSASCFHRPWAAQGESSVHSGRPSRH